MSRPTARCQTGGPYQLLMEKIWFKGVLPRDARHVRDKHGLGSVSAASQTHGLYRWRCESGKKGWHGWQILRPPASKVKKNLLVRNIGGKYDRDFTMPQSKLSGFAAQHRDDMAW